MRRVRRWSCRLSCLQPIASERSSLETQRTFLLRDEPTFKLRFAGALNASKAGIVAGAAKAAPAASVAAWVPPAVSEDEETPEQIGAANDPGDNSYLNEEVETVAAAPSGSTADFKLF